MLSPSWAKPFVSSAEARLHRVYINSPRSHASKRGRCFLAAPRLALL